MKQKNRQSMLWLFLFCLFCVPLLGLRVQTSDAATKFNAKKFQLNNKNITLQKGDTYTVKVKNVTSKKTISTKWSTDNAKVAVVQGKGKIKGKVTAKKQGTASITCKILFQGKIIKTLSCKVRVNAISQTPMQENTPQKKVSRTILMFTSGTDLEDLDGFLTEHLKRIMSETLSDEVNFLVMTGGTSNYFMPEEYTLDREGKQIKINAAEKQIWKLSGKEGEKHGIMTLLKTMDSLQNVHYLSKEPLKQFIDYSVEYYPAEKYDLIFWSHGYSIFGFGDEDVAEGQEYTADHMSIKELADALESSKINQKFDMINFDSCVMGNTEVLLSLSEYAENFVFSAEAEPATSQIYHSYLERLNQNPLTDGYTLGKDLVDEYIASFDDKDSASYGIEGTLCVVKSKEFVNQFMEPLKELTDILVKEAKQPGKNGQYHFYDEMLSARLSIKYQWHGMVDFGNLSDALGVCVTEMDCLEESEEADLKNRYTAVSQKIQKLFADTSIIYAKHAQSFQKKTELSIGRDKEGNLTIEDSIQPVGISIFFPYNEQADIASYANIMEEWIQKCKTSSFTNAAKKKTIFENLKEFAICYGLIYRSGKIVSELSEAKEKDLTVDTVIQTLEPNVPYDAEWLKNLISQQIKDVVTKDKISASIKENPENKKTQYQLSLKGIPLQTLDYLDMFYYQVRIVADDEVIVVEPDAFGNGGSQTDLNAILGQFSGKFNANILSNDAKNFIYDRKDAYQKQEFSLEAPVFDNKWYQLTDCKGRTHLVSIMKEPLDSSIGYIMLSCDTKQTTEDGYNIEDHSNIRLTIQFQEDGSVEITDIDHMSFFGPVPFNAEMEHIEHYQEMYTAYGDSIYFSLIKLNQKDAVAYDLKEKNLGFSIQSGVEIKEMDDVTDQIYQSLNQKFYIKDIYGISHDITEVIPAA